jgi:iron complex transport system substrate-binding protein
MGYAFCQNASMRRSATFLLTLVAVLSVSGCREEPGGVGGTHPSRRVKTVATLNLGATEIIRSRIPEVTLVGRTAQCNWPPMDAKIPVVMNGLKPNYERLAQLRPGIAVYDEQLFSKADIEKLKQLNIEPFAVTGDTVEKFIECETSVSEYIEEIYSAMSAAAGAPPAKKVRVAIMMPGQGSEHYIAGVDSLYADAVRKAQGEPVGPKGATFVPVNAETLVALNPDAIVCSSDPKPILSDSRLQSISAIKSGKVGKVADPDVLLRRGGRLDKLIRTLYDFIVKVAE